MQTRSSDENSVRASNAWIVRKRKKDMFRFLYRTKEKAVIPSEKSSINTNKKSPMRFRMSLRWSSYTVPLSLPRGAKNAKRPFSSKIALHLKKVCYKVYSCENCQRQSCRAFIGLTIHAKCLVGNVPFYLKFWVKVTVFERNRRFSIYFRLYSASAVTPSEKSSIISFYH